jgi:hypothetical protein
LPRHTHRTLLEALWRTLAAKATTIASLTAAHRLSAVAALLWPLSALQRACHHAALLAAGLSHI